MLQIENWLQHLSNKLSETVITSRASSISSLQQGFNELLVETFKVKKAGGTIYFCGNGASAAMASHYALDFWKNGKVRASTFFDISQVTALSNDLSYDQVFSAPLEMFSKPGDMLVGISSSGNSPNVVKAAEKAREIGVFVTSFTGFKPDNKLKVLSDLAIFVPDLSYGFVESAHAALLHYWIDRIIEKNSETN